MTARWRLTALAVAGVAVAGCGGGEPGPVPTVAPGHFSGTDGHGVGAMVDMVGFDRTKRAIQAALARSGGGSVGIVSLVNRTRELRPIPAFWARTTGGLVAMQRSTRRLSGERIVSLPDPGPYIPVEGAMTVYVRFPGNADDIRGVVMRVGTEPPVELTPEVAPGP